jgi:hypothetical protein
VTESAFYCVADERYFLGLVALINSLRLQGHDEPVFVCDCGLTSGQRELLAPHATMVEPASDAPGWLQKTAAPLRHPADVMVLIDSDMVVTRPLGRLVEAAAPDRVVAFENDRGRFVASWGELLDLGPATPRPYVSSGLVCLGGKTGREVLGLLDDRQRRVDFERTFWRRNEPDYPFRYADQDVLNAILCTRVAPERVVSLEHRLAANPPFEGVRIVDRRTLRCAHADGCEPYVLHHFERKPWLVPIRHGLYSRLLSRLWLGHDVALRLPEELVPLRMRSGVLARAERTRVDAIDVFRRYVLKRPAAAP